MSLWGGFAGFLQFAPGPGYGYIDFTLAEFIQPLAPSVFLYSSKGRQSFVGDLPAAELCRLPDEPFETLASGCCRPLACAWGRPSFFVVCPAAHSAAFGYPATYSDVL
jgi:hypothetical protein